MRAHRVDAEGRLEHPFKHEIGGGKAERPSPAFAAAHMALYAPVMSEQPGGFVWAALLQGLPDARGRDLQLGTIGKRRENRHPEAFHLAHIGEYRRIASASLAEAEILAHHEMKDAEFT